jgi:hypothetical protein
MIEGGYFSTIYLEITSYSSFIYTLACRVIIKPKHYEVDANV